LSTALSVDDEKGDFVVISHDVSMIFWGFKHQTSGTDKEWLVDDEI